MKRLIFTFLLVAAVAPVAAFAANSPDATANAKASCTKLRATMGATAFTQAYPTFGACVSHYAPVEQQAIASAEATCTAQQADPNFASTHGGKTFDQYYGTGKNGSNASGKCVSTVAKANSLAEQQGRLNPAQSCRAQRTLMTASVFSSTYGANANDKNAFGKCVSKTASAQSQNEVAASNVCKAEQGDSTFASTHSNQTFDAVYGTNADKSNAFGKCVSSKAKSTSATQQAATVRAAKACATELKAGASAFKTKYGTFGRCVSQKAKA